MDAATTEVIGLLADQIAEMDSRTQRMLEIIDILFEHTNLSDDERARIVGIVAEMQATKTQTAWPWRAALARHDLLGSSPQSTDETTRD